MWNVLDFLVIFIVFATVRGAAVDSMENTFNCYADYLKRHGLIEEDFVSEPFNGDSFLCEVVLSTTVETVYADLLERFEKNEELKEAAACIVETLQEEKWSDFDIKEQVIRTSQSFTDEEKQVKIYELKQIQEKISNDAIVSCLAEKEFGELFDQIYEKDDQEDFVGDYCARMYAIQNSLLDTNVFTVNPNPNNLNTQDIKCEAINKQHFEEAEEELRTHLLKDIGENVSKVDCLIKKYHDNHYFNKTLVIAMLGELNITDHQKSIEKSKFVQSMIKITKDLSEC